MKKIILLLGYLAGIFVGSKFASQKKGEQKKGETIADVLRDAGDEIVEVHKRLIDKAKQEYWTEENKQYFFEKKEALLMYVDDFKAEALEKIDELKEAGADLSEKSEVELRKIYENRSEYLEKASNLGKKALASAQEKLDEVFDEVKAAAQEEKKPKKKPAKKPAAKKKTVASKKKATPKKKV